jgi:alpha-amylase
MNWFDATNIYEVNIRQYTPEGTFNAFVQHLARLKDMEVETLWFMPVTSISKKNMKGSLGSYYACSDYTSINPEFGNLNDFKKLVSIAHDLGFKVIIDWVANHTGWDHVWTKEHPEWYKRDQNGDFNKASGMDDIIELDYSNQEMRKEMIKSMKFWLTEAKIDGFRCDLAFWVRLDFWQQAIPELNSYKPQLFWLAESDPIDHPEYMTVFNAAYSWQWMHKSEDYAKGMISWNDLMSVLNKYNNVPGIKAWFTSNHDENSWNGSEYEKYGDMTLGLAVFSCTWKGLPLLYSGQELPNYKRLLFFDKDEIEWNTDLKLHSFYKKLLHLQRNNSALNVHAGLEWLEITNSERILAYSRINGSDKVIVIINFNSSETIIRIENIKGNYTDIFSGSDVYFDNNKELRLLPWQYVVAEIKKAG